MNHRAYTLVALSCGALLFFGLNGCDGNRSSTSPAGGSSGGAAGKPGDDVAPDTLLESVLTIVQIAKFDRTSQERYQVVSQRLNQFVAQSTRGEESPIQPMPTRLRQMLARQMRPDMLQQVDADRFDMTDMLHLETCYLLRDLARRITANSRDELASAEAIFDWVVRNVHVVAAENLPKYRVVPRVSLLLGMGSEDERAWVFMDLLRQVGIPSVMLGRVATEGSASYASWAPAALVQGQLYVFDTTLGLAIPGRDGKGVATLQQIYEDPSLLTALDIDAEHAYSFRPEHLKQLVVLYESSPLYNAPRMKFFQQQLSGPNRAVLWSDMLEMDEQVRGAVGDIAAVDLWPMPAHVHQVWQTDRGYSEQINQMFTAYSIAVHGANTPNLLDARLAQLRGNLEQAITIYLQNRNKLPQFVRNDENLVALHSMVRENSAYFLGLTKFDQGKFEAAADWFQKGYLDVYPEGRWRTGARYNLGRSTEAMNNAAKAIECYTSGENTPQTFGNLLRARRLGWTGPVAAESKVSNSESPPPGTR